MKKNTVMRWGLVLVSLLVLSGCGTKKSKEDGKKEATKEEVGSKALDFSTTLANSQKAIEGGLLEIGIVTDSPFQGIFSIEFYQDTFDSDLLSPASEGLFSADENYGITDDGVVKLDLDIETKSATLTIQKEAKWSDGVPLTSDDIAFSYELIGHKDYPGVRYTDDFKNVVGMEAYNEGEAEEITGIKKIDEKTLTIQFKEVRPGLLQQGGGGIWNSAAPKHYLKDLDIKQIESADEIRKKPLHYGPFVIDKIVPGESVTYVPNEYYYKDKPNLESIQMSVFTAASVVEALKSQKYDMIFSMPTDNYDTFKEIENYEYLGREEYAYSYLGFKLGAWNKDKKEVEMDDNAKMSNLNLRKAMAYAINNDDVGEKFYQGLRYRANSLIPPVFPVFYDSTQEGYPQDKEKARKLLADAGYVDVTEDGFVEDPEGQELVIKFATRSGSEVDQPLAEYYMQEWADIGLKVELTTGRLIDFQSFYDKVKNDDPEIDVYHGAWGTGSDPAPNGLYGRDAEFNYSRFASEENDELLKKINSEEAFDLEYRKEQFKEWQTYSLEQAFVIPTLFRYEILPVHKRVTGWDWDHAARDSWINVGVTSEKRK